jgi:hypothetical protein
MKAMNSVLKRVSLGFLFVFLCFISSVFSQESKGNSNSDQNTFPRLIDYFLIGEKVIKTNQKAGQPGIVSNIRICNNFGDINAFSIIDAKIDSSKDIFAFLKAKKYNVLLVADLRKKGEQTWNRISIINKYTWKIAGRSKYEDTDSSKPNNSPEPRIKPFYIIDEILSDSPYIREGDYVQIFFFNDVKQPPVYLKDLHNANDNSRPLVSIDAQEMYLVTTGSAPQKYSAKQGDEIRLRFLRAEYSIKKQDEVDTLLQSNKEPEPPQKFADIVSVEDETCFTFKEYGIKLFISPTVTYGSKLGSGFDWGNFNLIGKNPSLGSNIYIAYDGRNQSKKILNYLPGIHLSLLALNNSEDAQFTIGFVTSILPILREYFGIFFGWHNLKESVIGITFSPNINFKAMVGAEKTTTK